MNSPMRLGVSPVAKTPFKDFTTSGFDANFPHWNLGLCCLFCFSVVPPSLSASEGGTAPVCHIAARPLHPSCLSPPLLLVWMHVSFLTRWLSDFHSLIFCQFWLFFCF